MFTARSSLHPLSSSSDSILTATWFLIATSTTSFLHCHYHSCWPLMPPPCQIPNHLLQHIKVAFGHPRSPQINGSPIKASFTVNIHNWMVINLNCINYVDDSKRQMKLSWCLIIRFWPLLPSSFFRYLYFFSDFSQISSVSLSISQTST